MTRSDIILLGVTGFTGKHALRYVREFAKNKHLTWGVAGRDVTKIQDFLENLKQETGDPSVPEVPIITVDLEDFESIKSMAQKARLIINCCGPYRFMGEQVVKACVEAGTHHVDVSGEVSYMEKMQFKYNDLAKEKGVYIVSACGFESIINEMGLIFLKNNFQGTLHSVETFAKMESPPGVQMANIGSWNSAVHEIGNVKHLKEMRKEFYPNPLPRYEPKLTKKLIPFKTEFSKDWTVFAPVPDRSVMLRTQRYFYEEKKARPIQIQSYLQVEQLWHLFILGIMGLIFIILARFDAGRSLLLKYPRIFSAGFFDHKLPSEEDTKKVKFSVTLIGKGWKEVNISKTEQKGSPDRGIMVQIKGQDPGYGTTTIALTLAAIVILTETNKLPKRGGVFPPGAAFAETTLIEQLRRNNVSFEIMKEFTISP